MEVKPSMKYARNSIYDGKVGKLLDIYSQVLVVAADNIGATQLQNIRQGLRGDSVLLMGKNSMMQCAIRAHAEKTGNTAYLSLIPLLVGNVGVIFTKGDLKEVSDVVAKYKAGAPARVGLIERVGLISPVDFAVPPGHMDSQTSFVQELIQCFQWCSMSWEITLDPMFQGLVKYGKKLPK